MNDKRPEELSGHQDDEARAPTEPVSSDAPSTTSGGMAGDPRDADPPAGREAGSPPEPEPELPEPRGPASPPPPEAPAAPARRGGGLLAFLALLIALAAAGGAGYLWWSQQQEGSRESTALAELRDAADNNQQRLSSLEQRLEARIEALDQAVAGRRQALDALNRGLESLEKDVAQAQERLASLADTEPPAERSPSLADAEYLLLVASRELSLADNHQVALAALREADRRLRQVGDPGLLPVRRAISDDIAAIEAAADSDADGLAMRLGSLADRVQGLPLSASLTPEPIGSSTDGGAAASGWERFKQRLSDMASGLFRIRRMDAPPAPLLSPEESFFLYRNVELDLKAARLAAMEGDQANYDQSLNSAQATVEDFFLAEDPAVKSFLSALAELRDANVAPPEWPDIGETLESLRSVTETHGEA
ncbi:MAG: uroporphyrinogen-III C-methyltransferase [Gammaproteobacteria bacterium]